jgi:tetratricopeptide (TPR) repeat protein
VVNNTFNGGQAHVVIQSGSISGPVTINLAAPAEAAPVVWRVRGPDQTAPEAFAGRTRETEDLLARLAPEGEAGAAVVTAVVGMGGAGKTALAQHVSAIAVARSWFAGGTVVVDLHGYDPDGRRVRGPAAFAPLLSLLGVAGERIPATEPEQAAAYHDRLDALARQGRRVLLVLDNVSSADQVRDLLPHSAAHRAVVTTRDALALPAARPLELEVPTFEEARAMLERLLHRRSPGDVRVGREPAEAARVVAACGRLPLAVGIAAALLADDDALSLAGLADELEQAGMRGEVLRHGESSVAPVFDLSWRRLQARDPSAARLLPLLVLNPGPEVSTEAAAALAGEPVSLVGARLRRLRQAHLLHRVDGHWRMHDLIRSRARGRTAPGNAEENDPSAAVSRLLEHYVRAATAAAEHLTERPDRLEEGEDRARAQDIRGAGRREALDWFARERPNLLAAVPMAAAVGRHRLTADLAEVLFKALDELHDPLAQAAVAQHAVDATAHLGDAGVHAVALHRLGSLHTASGRHTKAIAVHRQALEIRRAAGDRNGEGAALYLLGSSLLDAGRPGKATTTAQQAVNVYRAIGDLGNEARAHGLLARIHCLAGRHEQAVTAHRRAIAMHRDAENPQGEAGELNNLGNTLWQAGRIEETIGAFRQAADVSRTAGDQLVKAIALTNLAMHAGWLGRTREAVAAHQEAIETFRSLGDVEGESTALCNLAAIHTRTMQPRAAVAAQRRAIEVCRDVGHRRGEGLALSHLGQVLAVNGNLGGAIDAHRQAVDIWRDLTDREAESRELKTLASRLAEVRQYGAARQAGEEAVEALNDTGRQTEATTVEEWLETLPTKNDEEPRVLPPHELTRVPRVYTTPKGFGGGCLPFLAAVGAILTQLREGPWWLVMALVALASLGWGTCLTSLTTLATGAVIIWSARGTWWLAAGLVLLALGCGSLATGVRRTEGGQDCGGPEHAEGAGEQPG